MPALVLLCAAQFVVVLDVTIVAVALPAIRVDLGFSVEGLQWVVSAYTLVFGGLLVVAGRAGDLFGRRRLFTWGLAVFGLASLACGLAPSAEALVALRAVQGLGAAVVAPNGLSILTATFPEGPARRRAVAVWTAAAAGGGAAGWVVGGLLAGAAGWRWIFLVNAPVGLAAAVLARRVLAESRGERRALDLSGALTLTTGIGLLVAAVEREAWPLLVAAAALLSTFVLIERRVADPLVPLGVLRARPFPAAVAAAAAVTATTTPPMFLAVLVLQRAHGLTPLETGLACAPVNLAVIAGSLLGSRWLARAGAGRAMGAGLVAIASAATVLASTGALAAMLVAFVVMGGGLGVASVASTSAGTAALGAEHRGLASGVLNAAAQLGTVLGLGLLVSVAAAGFAWGFAGAAVIAVAAAAGTARPWSRPA